MFEFLRQHKTPSKTVVEGGVLYEYTKKKGAKHLKIRISGKNSVKVTVPFQCTFLEAQNFVSQNGDWIEKSLSCVSANAIDENFKTKSGNLIITTGLLDKPKILSKNGVIQFIYPIGADFKSDEIQKIAKLAAKKAIYLEAKEFLPKRLDELAQKFGFRYGKIALKTSKTRWGSCSFKNNINLNINLMLLDLDEIDYVLLHELCHTVEKNHGREFWNLLDKCIPNSKKIRAKLKKEKMMV